MTGSELASESSSWTASPSVVVSSDGSPASPAPLRIAHNQGKKRTVWTAASSSGEEASVELATGRDYVRLGINSLRITARGSCPRRRSTAAERLPAVPVSRPVWSGLPYDADRAPAATSAGRSGRPRSPRELSLEALPVSLALRSSWLRESMVVAMHRRGDWWLPEFHRASRGPPWPHSSAPRPGALEAATCTCPGPVLRALGRALYHRSSAPSSTASGRFSDARSGDRGVWATLEERTTEQLPGTLSR